MTPSKSRNPRLAHLLAVALLAITFVPAGWAQAPTRAPALPAESWTPSGEGPREPRDLIEPVSSRSPAPLAGASLRPMAGRLAIDLKDLARLPIDAKGKAWAKFSLGLAVVGALHSSDEQMRANLDPSAETSRAAEIIRPLGQEGGLALLVSSWAIGRMADKPKAYRIGRDGLEATVLSAGILAPLVKELVGRERPRKDLGSISFGSGQSFPSGEVTQAFAIASVVSAHSRRKWVKGLAWTLAGATAWQRMEMDAHWASDVAAGALLGAGVGRWVVRRNRGDWWIEPRLEQGGAGVTLRRQW